MASKKKNAIISAHVDVRQLTAVIRYFDTLLEGEGIPNTYSGIVNLLMEVYISEKKLFVDPSVTAAIQWLKSKGYPTKQFEVGDIRESAKRIAETMQEEDETLGVDPTLLAQIGQELEHLEEEGS